MTETDLFTRNGISNRFPCRCLIEEHISPCRSEKHNLKSQCLGLQYYPTNKPNTRFRGPLMHTLRTFCVTIQWKKISMLTVRVRTKIRPVQANSHFPHPLPCHICVHLVPGQLELHDFEKQQGCHLPARSYLRKHGKQQKMEQRYY